ncbi:glutamate racemase [uncultured Muribaculum sp.]|uniref:glutamate racemase n=1 Tax=uncultured Muribaculum sp. TaxID=1918613 RepID=UPI0025EF5408|nr:glutamate racemase [uncultured Muribaculum sp.]
MFPELLPAVPGPIGVFDSGFGGLTILRDICRRLPDYDYLFLGDNARAPYGTRSFDVVYRFTLQAVRYLFAQGCHLVILACNTASAKALRTIQQCDLPAIDPSRRVLGVIRPTVEILSERTRNGHIGIVGTPGTVASRSYDIEIGKMHPDMRVTAHACPMWVPLVENRETTTPGARYFVERDIRVLLDVDPDIDTLILGCTHYPLLSDMIRAALPAGVDVLSQGRVVADSLADYLRRHPDMAARCTIGGTVRYLTTENADRFSEMASMFMGHPVQAVQVEL